MSSYPKERAQTSDTAIKWWSQVLEDFQLKCMLKRITLSINLLHACVI